MCKLWNSSSQEHKDHRHGHAPGKYWLYGVLLLVLVQMQVGLAQEEERKPELVYAEMEFPLSLVGQIPGYAFDPLGRRQTQEEGRMLELTCDPLVDIYQDTETSQLYRPGLASWTTTTLRDKSPLSFNLIDASWANARRVGFEDLWFSLEYRKYNPNSWAAGRDLVLEKKGEGSFDAYLGNTPMKTPKPGEFYFPIVNKDCYWTPGAVSQAQVQKKKYQDIGYGRYSIRELKENESILFKRRPEHPYYKDLQFPEGWQPIEQIRMRAFPRARISRNEQFIQGRLHLITSVTQEDVSYILNAYPQAQVSRYFDDSFSGFVFNCQHPYLAPAPIRRALNCVFRKRLALSKALRGDGELISGPIPRNNFFYNLDVPVYDDSAAKALAILWLYVQWGLDLYEEDGKLHVHTKPLEGPAMELEPGDILLEIDRERPRNLQQAADLLAQATGEILRVKVARADRVLVVNCPLNKKVTLGLLSSLRVSKEKVLGFQELTVIANNPQGKDPLIKEICGALKEDLEKVGIPVQIDYLSGEEYYPRLQKGDFALAFRTLKLTGTPNLYRLFYGDASESEILNVNYGRYANEKINRMAMETKELTELNILGSLWKEAHRLMHHDPPHIFLWSRRHIVIYNPVLSLITPNPQYKVPHGYKKIDGLINIFNEVHLWALKKSNG